MTANRYGLSFGNDENVLKLFVDDGCESVNILKKH